MQKAHLEVVPQSNMRMFAEAPMVEMLVRLGVGQQGKDLHRQETEKSQQT
jgi:hypothetical protein